MPEGIYFPTLFPSENLESVSSRIIQPNEFIREYVEDSENSVALLRAANVLDGELNTGDLVFVAKEKLSRARDGYADSYLQTGDILITRTGANAGATCVVRKLQRPFIISSHSIRVVPKQELVDAAYLELFLLSRWGKAQINRLFTGAAQRQLQLATVAKISICLPPLDIQRALVAEMEAARESRRAKLNQADELLNSLDGWLLAQLGLEPPQASNRNIYAVRRRDVIQTARLNADYFHPERILNVRAMQASRTQFTTAALREVVEFVRDLRKMPEGRYIGLANVQSHTGELVTADEEVQGNCLAFQENDVLFGRLRPYLNKVYRAEFSGVCSPEFHVLRGNGTHYLNPDYLATILRSSPILAQTRHMMTGNTHPRLTNDDVINLVIPIPTAQTQEKVAAEVNHRRIEARRLRAEAEAEWQAAKERFEQQLLTGK